MSDNNTVIGFDYGEKRIGVAVGQTITGTASALTTIHTRKGRPDWELISSLIEQWQPGLFVVGIPRHADGSAHAITHAAERFIRQLEVRYRLPVSTIDERLSSHEAGRLLKNTNPGRARAAIDPVAAKLILESWFEQQDR